jgi:hypothetical protein
MADDTLKRMQQVADIAAALTVRCQGKDLLKNLPGKGNTNLQLGMRRVIEHAQAIGMIGSSLEAVERMVLEAYAKGAVLTDSPIERSMLAGLVTGRWNGFETVPPAIHDARRGSSEDMPPGDIVIVPQMTFLKYRLDFGIVVERHGRLAIFAVECDGADYHDIYADQRRDLYLASWGVPTFRATGKALYEDATAEADRVISAICHWRAS